MPADWNYAIQVGIIGFVLVFVILIVLYLALALTGWLSAKYSPAAPKTVKKPNMPLAPEKKASQTG